MSTQWITGQRITSGFMNNIGTLQSYSPLLYDVTNGAIATTVNQAYYTRMGNLIIANIELQAGATTTTGVCFDLPTVATRRTYAMGSLHISGLNVICYPLLTAGDWSKCLCVSYSSAYQNVTISQVVIASVMYQTA